MRRKPIATNESETLLVVGIGGIYAEDDAGSIGLRRRKTHNTLHVVVDNVGHDDFIS